MKLFFDEDMGKGIPHALWALGVYDIDYVADDRPIRKGTLDDIWIPYVGQHGYLLISCNKAILENEAERTLIIQHRVGAVFLSSGQARRFQTCRLLLQKWEWLEEIDAMVPRPFAFLLPLRGRPQRRPL